MKNYLFSFCLLIIGIFFQESAFSQKSYDIIPKPVSEKISDSSSFIFNQFTKIICNTTSEEYDVAQYLHKEIKKFNPFIPEVAPKLRNQKYNYSNSIIFVLSSSRKLGKEGYEIEILKDRIVVLANENAGFFYACQTILQLIMPEKDSKKLTKTIPCGSITDYPRFSYRGKHLDCVRHFFTKDEVKKYIDILAFHKLNTFHWHLTDDQGWRIEIKKYPLLQSKAAYRNGTLIGNYSWYPQRFDTIIYGGYYTQEDIKEVIAYAKERFINIIPEIEMPGHALAALTAYPLLGCKGENYHVEGSWGVFDDVFCTKEETFSFLEDVLTEVIGLFPYQYIHIGGDECPKTRWKECRICQNNMKKNNLKTEEELQAYFINRIEKFVEEKGKKIIGWDEILEGDLKGRATIMSWRGEQGAISAALKGNMAIMTPNSHLYFDYYQGLAQFEPLAIGGYIPLEKVYNYEPIPKELNKKQEKFIWGVQANTWTEYISTFDKLQYMDLPRMAALSEVAWSKKEDKDYKDFEKRLEREFKRYDFLGYKYSTTHLHPYSPQ
ncbi:MAG: beta-N-acetylhexosaminidase [Bacteroidales bacterium]|jgi:hexosaminidase|nr:beta-N-acetylhexosaminidase [Bacteroidales bacterium]